MAKNRKPMIDPSDVDLGTVLTCAVRYSLGRQTYMPHLVVDFIRPLLPYISDNALWAMNKDIQEAERIGLGDPLIDAPMWREFHEAVKAEMLKRARKGD